MNNSDPVVSICCITYNQENYIKDTIEGFLLQETSFPIEIIIHDDCSTDNTANILREYADKFPKLIKPIYQEKNQYSLGRKIFPIVFSCSVGKYIAVCEGDDYWTDPNKLQRQVDFLEANPEYVMVTENSIFDDQKKGSKRSFSDLPERNIDILDMLKSRQFATASVLFKNLGEKLVYGGEASGDTILWCHLSKFGKIRYLKNISSVYRRHSEGVTGGDLIQWSKKMVIWNKTLHKNHPEIDNTVFIERNIRQFKIPVSEFIKDKNYREALLAIDELSNYTSDPLKYKKELYDYFDELLMMEFNSWSFRIGNAFIFPIKKIFYVKNKIIQLINSVFRMDRF